MIAIYDGMSRSSIMSKKLRVLVVEDSEDDTLLLVRKLRQGGYDTTFERVQTAESMKEALDKREWDIIISDYVLPTFNGSAALDIAKRTGLDLPFIIVSGKIGEDAVVEVVKAGAHDCIMKDNLSRLVSVVKHELLNAEVRRERKQAEESLRQHKEHLEELVKERTAELLSRNAQLAEEIVERERTEEALRRAKDEWERTFDAVPDLIAILDDRHRVVRANRAMADRLGRTPDESVGLPCYVAVHGTERPPAFCPHTRTLADCREHTAEVREDQLGGHFLVSTTPIFDEQGKLTGSVHVARDITKRKRAEDALRESEERFRLMVEAVQEYAIFMLDPEGNVASWNVGAERIKGYKAEEIIGRNFSVFYPHDDIECGKPQGELKAAVWQNHVEDAGWRVRKDGSRFWANVVITALNDEAGNVKGFAKITRDLTEHKKAEEALRIARDQLELRVRERTAELEKANTRLRQYNKRLEALNKELQDFAFVASHDLQEPLRKVRTFGDMLSAKCGVSLDEASRDYIKRMQRAAARMQNLINSLLSYSRVTTNSEPIDEIDLDESVKTALSNLEMMSREKNARVEVGDLPTIRADRVQMVHLFQNLIGNALKFQQKGQSPHVKIYARIRDDEGIVEICIEDNGIGFEEKYLNKIFQPFQRLHGRGSEYEGVGMGLAICKKIVERHGGKITARSQLGRGSTFIVTIPVERKSQ
jgi:PAS domain S-box-containing protein